MSLERFIREQSYYYKRKKLLKDNRRKGGVPKAKSTFMVLNGSQGSPRRIQKSPQFYGTGFGGKQIAGIGCIILGGVLLLTTCFSTKVEEVKSEEDKIVAQNEMKVEVQSPMALVAQSKNEEVLVSKKEEVKGDSDYYQFIQDFDIEGEELEELFQLSMKQQREFADVLALWSTQKMVGRTNKEIYKDLKKYETSQIIQEEEIYEEGRAIYKQFIYDIKYFPVAKHKDYTFEANWKKSSLFEGNKMHYGVDIMDPKNSSGKVPIVSMSDGVIENIGWNDTGGYRIGVRSSGGAYFYYAHLHELPMHIKKGDAILAGDLIGLMGNTGYGVEGTIGKVPVHLHIGIAVKSKEGKEFWINPYPLLKYIENEQVEVKAKR